MCVIHMCVLEVGFWILNLIRTNQSTLNLKTEMAKVSKREQRGGFALKLVLINCKIESIFLEAIMQNITTFPDKSFDLYLQFCEETK